MSTVLVTRNIWQEITNAVRISRKRCVVAVAYFGAGASRRLPLPKGSRLVVDASERAVMSGQTCPADLQKMLRRGVAVYSVPNLHAKVFVVGKTAYIGSTNVSKNSASKLIEATIRTTEPSVVSAARTFVSDHCLQEQSPELLKQLGKLYRPPRIPGGDRTPHGIVETSKRPTLSRTFLAQLIRVNLSDYERDLREKGISVAKQRRQHPRKWKLDDFCITGMCPYERGDVVIQVVDEGGGRLLVDPPANVLHVRSGRSRGNKLVSFVYVELPTRRRRQVKSLARALGCTQKQLRRDGRVRNAEFAQSLRLNLAVSK